MNKPLKIMLCHNYYQIPGGEDSCFADEGSLLEQHGHEVLRFTTHNKEVNEIGSLRTAMKTFWNRAAYRKLYDLMRRERPDVVHCTNTFPLISPAVYYAAHKAGVAVVQSLHNYRLLCPNAQFLRNDAVCEQCLTKLLKWPAVLHGCYRGNRLASGVVAGMLAVHRMLGTWSRKVDRYIALTEFARSKLIAGGLPADKIVIKPNFARIPETLPPAGGNYAVFVGRLSHEKGISTLLAAWERMPDKRLVIVGQGPLADEVRAVAARAPHIEFHGPAPASEVIEILRQAKCLITPSIWYEVLPRVIVESYGVGTPVIASRLGGLADLVIDRQSGLLFNSGDAVDLESKVCELWQWPHYAALREGALWEFRNKYTPEQNYNQLISIYAEAIEECHGNKRARPQPHAPAQETPSRLTKEEQAEMIATGS